MSVLTDAYGWVGPMPDGWVPAEQAAAVADLLARLDRMFSAHPDAMLDIVDVRRTRSALRIYCRLSRKDGVTDDLNERVAAAIGETELRSAAKDRRAEIEVQRVGSVGASETSERGRGLIATTGAAFGPALATAMPRRAGRGRSGAPER